MTTMTSGDIDYSLRIGDHVTLMEDVEALPVGARLWSYGQEITKTPSGSWSPRHARPEPDGETSLIACPNLKSFDTIEQYRWRIFDMGLAAGRRYGVAGVPDAMAQLGLRLQDFPFGVGMRISNFHLEHLPEGTVVSVGSPESDSYSLFERTHRGFERVYGPPYASTALLYGIVEQVGDDFPRQEWIDRVATEDDRLAIRAFKGEVWRIGDAARHRYGWCDTFMRVMGALSISAADTAFIDPAATRAGTQVSALQAANLPVGTLLESVVNGIQHWFIRDDRGRNRAGTSRFAAWNVTTDEDVAGGGHFDNTMTVLGMPGDLVHVSSRTDSRGRRRYRGLPNGTCFRRSTTNHNLLRKVDNDRYERIEPTQRTFQVGEHTAWRSFYVVAGR